MRLFLLTIFISLQAFSQSNNPNSYSSLVEAFKNPQTVTRLELIDQNLFILDTNIEQLSNLDEIILDENPNLDLDQAMTVLSKLKNLKKLSLSKCKLKFLPLGLAELNNLEDIDLDENDFEDIPRSIRKLKNLKYLNLFDNKIKNITLKNGDLTSLTHINLGYNLFEIFPTELGIIPNLILIRIWYNNISLIPKDISNFSKLQELNLEANNIGVIPEAFSKLYSLKILSLQKNNLTKNSLSIISKLNKLESLDIGTNELFEIPNELNNLKKLKCLDLSFNKITSLPTNFSKFSKLEQIGLGALVDFKWESAFYILSQIKSLRRVGMFEMHLTTMPKGFETLSQVKTFWLTFNSFNKQERDNIVKMVPNSQVVFD